MDYDVIVIGAGHAGCEAALASARLGMKTCLCTMDLDTIAQMSCNPAIGGLAKGHLVREIDALGGQMAKAADASGIQFRMLNLSKGPAVRALRAQADRVLYRLAMRKALEGTEGLHIKQAMVEEIVTEADTEHTHVTGVLTSLGLFLKAKTLIVTTGTFLKGLIHIGLQSHEAGRAGEFPSVGLSASLHGLGLRMGRLKTGTPPRLDARSIDFSQTETQWGDDPAVPFSYSTKAITNPQLPCYMTYTNEDTHEIIRASLDRSPLYSGKIQGTGPRYCPSIEDKVVRFAHRPRHQIFLEPEGLETAEYYANGISTSLPYDTQVRLVRSIAGLADAEIMRPGYAIEYDYVHPAQLRHSLETQAVGGLFLAGQINGTSGYEEAAAQGLMAGVNASMKIQGRAALVLQRHEAYIGVLIDDLVTKDTVEPYRMFTSRAEYRLLLRHDNADMRLRKKGHELGLISKVDYEKFSAKQAWLHEEINRLKSTRVKPTEANPGLQGLGISIIEEGVTLETLLKRPEVGYNFIKTLSPPPKALYGEAQPQTEIETQVEIEIKYQGYIKRQLRMAEKLKNSEEKKIPLDMDYSSMNGLSNEVRLKLTEIRPESLGQAARIPGVTPAAISVILVYMKKQEAGIHIGKNIQG